MVVAEAFIWAFALAGSVTALPAGDRRGAAVRYDRDEQITVYDDSVTKPTTVPAQVAYYDKETAVLTSTEMIVVLPTPGPKDAGNKVGHEGHKPTCPSAGEWDVTTTTTMTRTSTYTVYESPDDSKGKPTPMVAVEKDDGPVKVPGHRPPSPPGPPPGPPPTESRPPPSDSGPGKAPNTGGEKLFGISYAPYKADHSCKSAKDIEDDFEDFAGDYSMVRIYGTDCDQVPPTYKIAKSMGVKLMMGIWDINQVEKEAAMIIDGLESDWDIVHSVSVGNELVNNGKAEPGQVVAAVKQARSILRKAGYEGPVVTVDTFIATERYPELCEESDYCAINAHPFFDSTMRAEDAGEWLVRTVESVKSKLSRPMDVVVTETGWPMNGMTNGLAVPGLGNQKIALDAIRTSYEGNPEEVILFSAFNDLWKQKDMGTFNADQYWGIGGAISRCDKGIGSG